jgi:hypothetical protein
MNQAAASDDVDEECIKVIPLPPGYYQPNVGLPNLPPTYSPPLNSNHPCGTDNNNTLPSATGRPPSQIQLNQILLASGVKGSFLLGLKKGTDNGGSIECMLLFNKISFLSFPIFLEKIHH